MIKVTRTITYFYEDERIMKQDMEHWATDNGIIIRMPGIKTILSETSQPITLPTFNLKADD